MVSFTEVVTEERLRDALEPGTWASAALEAGFEASFGEGSVRFLMLRGLIFEDAMVDDYVGWRIVDRP
jgi:hypothetical protein